ncbi:unnamed protein product, partial [Ilex paraguariensis]
ESQVPTVKVVPLQRKVCLDSGFFYVIDHGISEEFMDEVFSQSKRFFDLPIKEKMKLLRNTKYRGYTPVLHEHLDPINQVHGDYKEVYEIGVEAPENDSNVEKPFYGPNVWLSTGVISDSTMGLYGAGAHSDYGLITLLATDDVGL